MTARIIGRRLSQILVPAGGDQVAVHYPMPSSSRMNSVKLNQHLMWVSGTISILHAVLYGVDGFVIPMIDGDSAINIDTMWDNQVPKDVDQSAGAFDLDTGTTDTSPAFEVGELDLNSLFNLTTLEPKEVFRRRGMVTYAKSPTGYDRAGEDYHPIETYSTTIGKKVGTPFPAIWMLGLSSPSLDDTTATVPTAPTEVQWGQLQYLTMTLRQAFIDILGLVEAGAETPWAEAAAFIAQLLESAAFEESAAHFSSGSIMCYTQATFDMTVPGDMDNMVLTSE